MSDVDSLLSYCRANGRVCPIPRKWDRLWNLLPERKRKENSSWEPALPLILAAWWEASNQDKRERLTEHIRWASDNGALERVAEFLYSLPENEWHHLDD